MTSPRLLILGLVLAIVGNVALVAASFTDGPLRDIVPAGNLAAIVICTGAIWIVRNRERLRG